MNRKSEIRQIIKLLKKNNNETPGSNGRSLQHQLMHHVTARSGAVYAWSFFLFRYKFVKIIDTDRDRQLMCLDLSQ